MQKIIHQEVMIYHHFTEKQTEICQAVNCAFDALWKKPEGYELTVIGQFYHFLVLFLVIITIWRVFARRDEIIRGSCS